MRPSLVSPQIPVPQPSAEPVPEPPGHRSSPGRSASRRAQALAACAFGALVFGAGTQAFAQDQLWLKDRRYTEGPGVRVGDFEVHPGIAAEFGYDSNYFRGSDDVATASALRLRITPSI